MEICLYWLRRNLKRSLPLIGNSATQQDLTKFKIAIVLVRARTNRVEDIRPLATELLEKLPRAAAGALTIVGT
jgi:hypothetical protein